MLSSLPVLYSCLRTQTLRVPNKAINPNLNSTLRAKIKRANLDQFKPDFVKHHLFITLSINAIIEP